MRTACAWSEKLPFAGYSVVKDHSGLRPEPRLGRSRGPCPTPLPRSSLTLAASHRALALRSRHLSKSTAHRAASSGPSLKPPPEALRVLENTGLEPVTSWLQTRRSPS